MENALAEQREARSSISHSFDQLELVDMALNQSIVLGKSQPCHHRCFVSYHTSDKALQFPDPAFFHAAEPIVELLSGPGAQRVHELLDELVGQIHLDMQRSEQNQRFTHNLKKQETTLGSAYTCCN